MAKRSGKRWSWLLLGVFVGLSLLGVGVVIAVLGALFSDTTRDLDSFASPAEARAFVSAHSPVPLPDSVEVLDLRYQRFTDWHLQARVRFDDGAAVTRYLAQVNEARETNPDYCGPIEDGDYFFADTYACGHITRGETQSDISLVCATR